MDPTKSPYQHTFSSQRHNGQLVIKKENTSKCTPELDPAWNPAHIENLLYEEKILEVEKHYGCSYDPETSFYSNSELGQALSQMSISSTEFLSDMKNDQASLFFPTDFNHATHSSFIHPNKYPLEFKNDVPPNKDSPFPLTSGETESNPSIDSPTLYDSFPNQAESFDIKKHLEEFSKICDHYYKEFGEQYNFHISAEFLASQIVNGVEIDLSLFEKTLQKHILMAPYKPQNFTTTVTPCFFPKSNQNSGSRSSNIPFPWVLAKGQVGDPIVPEVDKTSKTASPPGFKDIHKTASFSTNLNPLPKPDVSKISNLLKEKPKSCSNAATSITSDTNNCDGSVSSDVVINEYNDYDTISRTSQSSETSLTLCSKELSKESSTKSSNQPTPKMSKSRSSRASAWGKIPRSSQHNSSFAKQNTQDKKNSFFKSSTTPNNSSYVSSANRPTSQPHPLSTTMESGFKSKSKFGKNKEILNHDSSSDYVSPFDMPPPSNRKSQPSSYEPWPVDPVSPPSSPCPTSSPSTPKVQYLGRLQYSTKDGLLEPLYETPFGHDKD